MCKNFFFFFCFYNIFIFVCCFLFIDTLCETSKSLASQILSASQASWCCAHLINPSFVDEMLTSQLYLKKTKTATSKIVGEIGNAFAFDSLKVSCKVFCFWLLCSSNVGTL